MKEGDCVSVVVVFFLTVSSSFVPSLPFWYGGGREGRCCLREWEGMEGWFGTVVQLPPSTGAVAAEKWYARNNYLSNDEVTSM